MKKIINTVLTILFFSAVIFLVILLAQKQPDDIVSTNNKNGIIALVPPEDIMDMAAYENCLFAGGRDGVYKITEEIDEYIVEKIDFEDEIYYVRALLVFDDKLWIGFDEGLIIYDIKSGIQKLIKKKDGQLPDDRVNELYRDSKGRIWIGTWSGAACIEDEKWSYYTLEEGLLDNMVNVIIEDSYGGMWFGSYSVTDGGVSCFYRGGWQYFGIDEGLDNENITAIIEDKNNNIIIGSGFYDRGGLAFLELDNDKWRIKRNMHKEDGLSGEKVRSLYEDDGGNLFIGSEYDGLSVIYAGGVIKKFTQNDGLSHNEIKCILEYNDKMWLGTRFGVTVWTKQGGI